MTTTQSAPDKPLVKPANPHFSSGPCRKHPDYDMRDLQRAVLGRSHRSKPAKERLAEVLRRSRDVLGLPDDYRIGIVPASDTGAFEMAMWNLLGAKGVDVLAWESFGKGWAHDITSHLKLKDVRVMEADYGALPDLSAVDCDRDIVFTWNGTTSGVCVPHGDWISAKRGGLTLCDATSAAFACELAWDKLDVTTYSWQKVMGGEAAHGMLILSPRAVARLESYTPAWPLPKIFRLTKGGKLIEGIFHGETINTPSMLAVEDYLSAMRWAEGQGGLAALCARSQDNLHVISEWVARTDWVDFLCAEPAYRSSTSICLQIIDEEIVAQSGDAQAAFAKKMAARLEAEEAAYDIGAYRDAPAGLRLWGGATVAQDDLQILTQWLDWAFAICKKEM